MGEIADAYVWAEMNGVDLDNDPEAWVEYYHEKDCDEYEEEILKLKKKLKNQKQVISRLKELLKRVRLGINQQIIGSDKVQYCQGTFEGELLQQIDEFLRR